ncbi:hypothetical protein BXY57_0148 [Thermoflavifilum aggregans]|uniref:Outer membrane protein with beta-barrel domain n=1 Tax=Thermoflavifilum aggregans TaxID=454188 RepID=A0A2M9CRZ0_9BACT|nr:hypothetical protein [Thermoflavifilum aggregans]PJJ74588.1 hypothetical protein BXY57_0148 [Thermoflavifilum aggregans]
MHIKHWFWVSLFSAGSLPAFSQTTESTKKLYHFSGSASVTNNGIALVPNFSLNRPAAIFLFSFGGKRFSVEPDIRFSLDAKPWTMLFWSRYQIIPEGKFQLRTGAHLGLNYKINTLPVDGTPTKLNVVRRYLAAELVPTYHISSRLGLGAYYLYARGLDAGTIVNSHFVLFSANLNPILPAAGSESLIKRFYLTTSPQVYYLNQDGLSGAYLNVNMQVGIHDFPLSLSSTFNEKLHSRIAGKSLIWNVSLVYAFQTTLTKASAPVLP